MKWIHAIAAATTAITLLSGCNTLGRQPQLSEALISPAQLEPGDSAVITVKVHNDRFGIVDRVCALVREDTRMKFDLRDDGNPPDALANDGIWSLQVDVPFMAPPGEFTLAFTAYDSSGDPIPVKSVEGGDMPLSIECGFRVVMTQGGQPEEQK